MQFNITFKTIFEYVLKKLVLCIQIRFVSTEKTTRIASRASCSYSDGLIRQPGELGYHSNNNNNLKVSTIDQFHFLFENEAGERYCFINILLDKHCCSYIN